MLKPIPLFVKKGGIFLFCLDGKQVIAILYKKKLKIYANQTLAK